MNKMTLIITQVSDDSLLNQVQWSILVFVRCGKCTNHSLVEH